MFDQNFRTNRFAALIGAFFLTLVAGFPAVAKEVKITSGGLTLNGQLEIVDGKSLRDGVVLIVHGTLAHNDMDTLKNLRAVLAEREMNTLAINLSLGINNRHGMYDCNIPHRHKHEDAVTEIDAWMDWLKEQNTGPVTLFGHSRGGNQAALYTIHRNNPMIERLVLLAPSTGNRNRSITSWEKANDQKLSKVLNSAETMTESGKGSTIMKKTGVLYCAGADVTAESFVSYYKVDPRRRTPEILNKIKIPVLVVAGSADTVLPNLPKLMGGKADGKRVQFQMIDGADHFFLDLFAEDIADFMEEFPGTGS